MKAKRLAPLVLLAPLALLTGCGGTPELILHANWYAAPVHATVIDQREELTYSVAYTAPAEGKLLAAFNYEEGTYRTVLQERSSLSSYQSWAKGTGYTYRTELKIKGEYTYAGSTTPFEDSVVSNVVFMNAENSLRPVLSEKTYCSTTFYGGAVVQYNYTYRAEYDEDLSEVRIELKDLRDVPEEDKLDFSDTLRLSGSGTFFDNEQILLALRAVDLSGTCSFRTVNPVVRERMDVSMTNTPQTVKYAGKGLTLKGDPLPDGDISAISFSIGYTDSKSGLPLSLVYAAPAEKNFRCALLEMKTTAPDGYGTFTYKLKELSTFNK